MSERTHLALEILLEKDKHSFLLSATQMLLAELDARLEDLAPPHSALGKWRSRALLPTLRIKLGLPLSLVLHLLVGPLNGVCLRNLVWHGYIGWSPSSRAALGHWTSLLWLIVAFGLPKNEPKTTVIPDSIKSIGGLVVADLVDVPSEASTEKLISASPIFLPSSMQPAFRQALLLCRNHHSKTCSWCALALLYVILERGLRCLFARENPFIGPCVAQTHELHITLATMLRSTVTKHDNNQDEGTKAISNGLLQYLGSGPIDALYDEFVWIGLSNALAPSESDPLPCRNELVHGALGLQQVPPTIVARVLKLTIGLVALTVTKDTSSELDDRATRKCLEWLQAYKAKRHPVCQIWRQFQSVVGLDQSHSVDDMLDTLLPLPSQATLKSRQVQSGDPLERRTVGYCCICGFPPEYCCYSPSAVKCFRQRFFGPTNSVTLCTVGTLSSRLFTRLSGLESDEELQTTTTQLDSDEKNLSLALESARFALIQANSLMRPHHQTSDNMVWSVLSSPPPRRSCQDSELGKLWIIRETVRLCKEVAQQLHRRLLQITALAACGQTRYRMGNHKMPLPCVALKLQITLQAAEIVLLVSFEQYLSETSTSNSLPSFLSAFVNTLLNKLENGHLQLCVAMGASLLGHRPDFRQLLQRFPLADREKFVLQLDTYIEFTRSGKSFCTAELITNKFALGYDASVEPASPSSEGESGADWESLRRWQLMSNTEL